MANLFDPIKLGAIEAPNRILMAPLTRIRATKEHVPTDLIREHYVQRASAGLILSEATGISREGLGWPRAPGIWNEEQVEAWKPVTEGVHKANGRIVCQLWHMGRLARADTTGMQPVSASETLAYEAQELPKNPYSRARAATKEDIARIVDDYGTAAANAMRAGFDGVQIHSANGYLIDQFLRDSTNHRDDEYGGSPENRMRLLKEVVTRVAETVGPDRLSVRLSPNGETQDCDDSNPEALFVPAARMLHEARLGYLELREQGPTDTFGASDVPKLSPQIRKAFPGPLVLNQEYTFETATADVESGLADAISFGRLYIANPDLVARFAKGTALNPPNPDTFYTKGAEGYTDYPTLEEAEAA